MRFATVLMAVVGGVSIGAGRADAPPDIWIEAETCADHNWSGPADFAGIVSGDKILRLWKDPDPGPEGYHASFPFRIEAAGKYHLWVGVSANSVSPFWWRLDGGGEGRSIEQDVDTDVGSMYGVSGCMAWVRLADVHLDPGDHSLSLKVTQRREILEHAYLLYLDALLITARDVQPDGLVTPADLPRLKPLESAEVQAMARAAKPGPPMLQGSSVGDRRQARILVSLGFNLLQTDSDHLTVNETDPGKWDWAAADAGLEMARAAGAAWQYFPHFHWAPDWLAKTDRFVPSVGLHTGRKLRCMSLWSPYLPEWFDHCYSAMAAHYGGGADKVAAIYLGIHGDFGEALFPMGYHPGERERFGEEGTGCGDYWCGDPHARAAFREWARSKYRTLGALNDAWGTAATAWDDVAYPPLPAVPAEQMSVSARRHWLDFLAWYHDSMTDFTAMVARTARKHFPHSLLMLPVGNGDESLVGGCDLSALVKICRETGTNMRSTHGGFQPVPNNLSTMLRRLASAAHFYGVPFWSEPPGGITPNGEVGRIFESLCCRATGFWDWGGNPVGTAKVFRKYKAFLTREETVCDVALLFPNTDQRLRPSIGYPPLLSALGPALRSATDFDIFDERMIEDGALTTVRVLVSTDGIFFAPEALARIEAWVRAGGVMVRGAVPMMTVEGDTSVWQRLSGLAATAATAPGEAQVLDERFLAYTARAAAGRSIAGCDGLAPGARTLATAGGRPAVWARQVGKGWVVVCAGGPQDAETFRAVVRDAVYHLPALDRTKKAARELAPDAAWGSLYTVLLKSGEVIAYSQGEAPVSAAIAGRKVEVAPHSLVSVAPKPAGH